MDNEPSFNNRLLSLPRLLYQRDRRFREMNDFGRDGSEQWVADWVEAACPLELTLFRGECTPDQFGNITRFELCHQAGLVHLDRARADVERPCDFLRVQSFPD